MRACLRAALAILFLLLTASASAAGVVSGKTPWAILLCKFSDRQLEPYTAKQIEPFFSEAGAGTGAMFDYWRDMSLRNVDLTGSRAFGWFTVKQTAGEYVKLGKDNPDGVAPAVQWCVDASKLKLTGFYGVIVIWNTNELGVEPFGILGRVMLPFRTASLPTLEPTTTAWAMGRGYGLTAVSNDPYDVMGFPLVFSFTGQRLGQSGPGLGSANRALLGWLDTKSIVTLFGKSKTTIDSLSAGILSSAFLARAPVTLFDRFEVDMRSPTRWDAGFTFPGVHVRRVGADGIPRLQPSTRGLRTLQAGDRVIDATYDRQVRVIALDPFALQADIEAGPVGPTAWVDAYPAANESGWNASDVEVRVNARHVVPRTGLPTTTLEVTGAQVTPPASSSGYLATVMVRSEGESVVHYTTVDDFGNVGETGVRAVRIDRTPPVSTATLRTQSNGDFVADIIATDPRPGSQASSGVREVRFRMDGMTIDGVIPGDRTGVVLSQMGWSSVTFWAIDKAGNEEYPPKTLTVQPDLVITPFQLNLAASAGTFGPAGSVTVENRGLASISIDDITTDSYYFVPQRHPYLPCGGVLAGGATCFINVAFYAPSQTEFDATLYIRTNDYHQTYRTVALHGSGVTPELTISPDPAIFPDTLVGYGSDVTITIANTTPGLVTLNAFYMTGPYFIGSQSCFPATILWPGQSCTITVRFSPGGYGPSPGALEVQSSLPGGSRYVSLQGFGIVPPHLSATPTFLNFPAIPVGEVKQGIVRFVNDGAVPYPLLGFSVGGGSGMFSVVNVLCNGGIPPYSFEPGQYCDVEVAYAPIMGGQHQAMLRADAAAPASTFEVPLSGEGL